MKLPRNGVTYKYVRAILEYLYIHQKCICLVSWMSIWMAEMSSHCRLVLLVVGIIVWRLPETYCILRSPFRLLQVLCIQDFDLLCPPNLVPFFWLFVTGSHKVCDHIADESASHILWLLRRSFSAKWSSVFQHLRLIAFTLCGMRLHFMYFMLPRSVYIILTHSLLVI